MLFTFIMDLLSFKIWIRSGSLHLDMSGLESWGYENFTARYLRFGSGSPELKSGLCFLYPVPLDSYPSIHRIRAFELLEQDYGMEGLDPLDDY